MNGGIFQPSIATGISLRGKETLMVPSALSGFSTPVAAAMAFSSRGGAEGVAGATGDGGATSGPTAGTLAAGEVFAGEALGG
jgi:hypothetical protein